MGKILSIFKKHKYISIVIVAILIGGGTYWYKRSNLADEAVQYKTAVAEKGTLTASVSGSGNVIVDQSATIDPTITGTVANLSVKVGDPVKKGDLLFSIINDELETSVAQALASYEKSKNSLESAKIDEDKAEADYEDAKDEDASKEQREVLKDKIDLAENKIATAERDLNVAFLNYQNQRSDSAKRKVTASMDGTVNAVNIKNGDDLGRLSSSSNSSAPIIIGDLNTLKAQVEVNEVDIPNVKIGQKAMMTFGAIEGLSVSGKVEKMDSLGTLNSGVVTYNVTISFDTLDQRIRPEMSVSASIITDVKQDVILVPSGAVKIKNGESYVQTLEGGTPQNRKVQVGSSNNTETEITDGISAGDDIITQTITAGTATSSSSSSSGSSSSRGNTRIGIPGIGR